jgi:hypothetical protein
MNLVRYFSEITMNTVNEIKFFFSNKLSEMYYYLYLKRKNKGNLLKRKQCEISRKSEGTNETNERKSITSSEESCDKESGFKRIRLN